MCAILHDVRSCFLWATSLKGFLQLKKVFLVMLTCVGPCHLCLTEVVMKYRLLLIGDYFQSYWNYLISKLCMYVCTYIICIICWCFVCTFKPVK